MAVDKTGTWSFGESVLWFTPTSWLDAYWSFGESIIFDEYTSVAPATFNPAWARNSNVLIQPGAM
jgi:hypothetical protein